jgi:HD superfamily phosphohydrolase
LTQIEKLILGSEEPLDKYKSDILNGPFDADKIDYLFRDGHFSGIPLVIDLDRLWYSTGIQVIKIQDKDWRRLVIDYSGTGPIEQIFFNRVQLYPSLYHHQKVRAALCMFKGIIEYIQNNGDGICLGRRQKVKFTTLADFLWGSELDFYAIATNTTDDKLHKLIHDLQYRRLLKRAMILSRNTLNKDSGFRQLMALRHQYKPDLHNRLRQVARQIWKLAREKGVDCEPEQIWIDLPSTPKVGRDIDRAYIRFPDDKCLPMTDVFPISQWLELYDVYKWQGHIFVPAGLEQTLAPIVNDILKQELQLNAKPEAFTRCHLTPPL